MKPPLLQWTCGRKTFNFCLNFCNDFLIGQNNILMMFSTKRRTPLQWTRGRCIEPRSGGRRCSGSPLLGCIRVLSPAGMKGQVGWAEPVLFFFERSGRPKVGTKRYVRNPVWVSCATFCIGCCVCIVLLFLLVVDVNDSICIDVVMFIGWLVQSIMCAADV